MFNWDVSMKSSFLIYSLLLLSMSCYSSDKELIAAQSVLKPECAPYCDKINTLLLVFVDEIKVLTPQKRNDLIEGLNKSIKSKGSNLRVSILDMEKMAHYYQPSTSKISAEVNFHQDEFNKSILKIKVVIVAPNRFYSDEFSCLIEDDRCVDTFFKNQVSKNIEDYLFKPTQGSIL
jgi:hypothetical protein